MSEYSEQCALFEWAATCQGRAPELALLYHWPNGEKRDKRTAARLKAAGVRRGALDCWLFVRRGDAPGMAFEMKCATGRLTPEQRALMAVLQGQGWRVGVYHAWYDAARDVAQYLGYDPAKLGL